MNGSARSASSLLAAWIALVIVTPVALPAQPELLPSRTGEWTRDDSVEVYVGRDLYLLIDGGADLFFEYGFVRVLCSEYSRINKERVVIELYEMESPSAAFGLFTSWTAGTGTSVAVGQGAVLGDGYCIVWKGAYALMLTAASGDSASGHYLVELASGLAAGILPAGLPPDLCVLLRENGLEGETMVFIRGKLARGNHIPEVWADPLPSAEGVLGISGGVRYLILECQDTVSARRSLHDALSVWKDLHLSLQEDFRGTWIIEQADASHALLTQHGRYILATTGTLEAGGAMLVRLEGVLGNR